MVSAIVRGLTLGSHSAVSAGFTLVEVRGGAAVQIDLRDGQLDFDVSDDLKARLKMAVGDLLLEGHRNFVLNAESVELIDSCGVGLIIALHHQVAAAGGVLAVCNTCPFVLKVLRMMQLDKFLTLFPTLDKALKVVADAT